MRVAVMEREMAAEASVGMRIHDINENIAPRRADATAGVRDVHSAGYGRAAK